MATTQLGSIANRKRSRNDALPTVHTTPYTAYSHSWSRSFSPSSASPAPLANSRYHLANGLDTPTTALNAVNEKYDLSASSLHDLDFRRGRPYSNSSSRNLYESEELPAPLAHERNGQARAQADITCDGDGWSKTVFTTLSGAAGKVWDFCRSGVPFRGFFAGGGQGHIMATPSQQGLENMSPSGSMWEDFEGSSYATPMPGEYPKVPTYIENYMDAPSSYETSERASKKSKHTYSDQGQLSNNWVMVSDTPSRRKTPTPQSLASPAPLRRQQASRPSMKRSVPSPLSTSRPASAAGLRSPNVPRHSRNNSRDIPTTPKSARPSLKPQQESPIAKETAKHLKDIRRREKQEDREIMEFNKKLQDMIREGKEALGSKIEVEMDDSDGNTW